MNKISQYIRDQFPAVYQDLGDDFVSFIEAYYEYMEVYHSANKDALESMDIDKTLNQYVKYFKQTYLKNFPMVSASDTRFVIKHIKDFYSSKGTELSTELLLKIMFGDNAKLYYPGLDVFKPSDSKWSQPIYLEVTGSDRNYEFIDKQIVGTKSRARAIVEGVVTKRINGKYIDVLYVSSLKGNFLTNETVSNDGILKNAPKIIGSLTEIEVLNGGRNNKVGDVFDVIYENGKQGKARVAEVQNSTGRVDFNIVDGGSGFTATSRTAVYISSGVLFLKNEDQLFIDFERVEQKLETLDLLSTEGLDIEVGHTFHGVNENGVKVAEGVIVNSSTEIDVNNNSNTKTQLLITSGTFDNQRRLITTSNVNFLPEETLEEENTVNITIGSITGNPIIGNKVEQIKTAEYGSLRADISFSGLSGTFEINETISQNNAAGQLAATGKIIEISSNTMKIKSMQYFNGETGFSVSRPIAGMNSGATASVTAFNPDASVSVYTDYAFGIISAKSGNVLTINPAWGNFEIGTALKYINGTTATGTSTAEEVDYIETGARGSFTSKPSANNYVVQNIFGDFTVGKKIRGSRSFKVATISQDLNEGATDVWYDGISTANGVIDLIANTTASGIVIGQNTSSIGVYGNTHSFISSGDINLPDTRRTISAITSYSGDIINIVFTSPHSFVAGDVVNVSIDLQYNNEVKYYRDLVNVISSPSSTSIRIMLSKELSNIAKTGQFSLFESSCEKTITVEIKTARDELLEPPRNSSGDIIEISAPVISISTGYGADFDIGEIENTETVFVDTDIIGGNNIANVAYTGIQVNAANSGIGFVDTIIVNSGGSGYSNGEVITFSGGGYADGDPLIPAYGVISTSGAGVISMITMMDHGQGYWTDPSIVYPGNNTTADLEVSVDYGYGFPKSPNGDEDNMLMDLWTSEEFTIGTIASLSNINPGKEYNANPFVRVYNSYLAGFGRTDFLLTMGVGASSYIVGESLTQTIQGDGGASEYAKGYVVATSEDAIIVRRTSFNTAFTDSYNLIGSQSGVSMNVLSAKPIEDARVMGDNANITATVISADGIVTKLDIIDSGYGYENGEEVSLVSPDKPFIVTGVSILKNQGRGEGFWKTFTSHIDNSSRIHDNDYYQEFSYEIISSQSIEQYETVLKDILHVAGNKLFGKVEKETVFNIEGSQIDGSIDVHTHLTIQGFWNDNYDWVDDTEFDKSVEEILTDNMMHDKISVYHPDPKYWFDANGLNVTNPGTQISEWKNFSNTDKLVSSNSDSFVAAKYPRKIMNSLQNSFDFSLPTWIKENVTVSSNEIVIDETVNNAVRKISAISTQPAKVDEYFTFTIDISKYSSGNIKYASMYLDDSFGLDNQVNIDLETGEVVFVNGTDVSASSYKISNGIFRLSMTAKCFTETENPEINISMASNSDSIKQQQLDRSINAGGFVIDNVQMEKSSAFTSMQKVISENEIYDENEESRWYVRHLGNSIMSNKTNFFGNSRDCYIALEYSSSFQTEEKSIIFAGNSTKFVNMIDDTDNFRVIAQAAPLQFNETSDVLNSGVISAEFSIEGKYLKVNSNEVEVDNVVDDQSDTSATSMANSGYRIGDFEAGGSSYGIIVLGSSRTMKTVNKSLIENAIINR